MGNQIVPVPRDEPQRQNIRDGQMSEDVESYFPWDSGQTVVRCAEIQCRRAPPRAADRHVPQPLPSRTAGGRVRTKHIRGGPSKFLGIEILNNDRFVRAVDVRAAWPLQPGDELGRTDFLQLRWVSYISSGEGAVRYSTE